MSVIEIIKRNFEHEVIYSDRPGILLYSSSACDKCRAFFPILDQIADENIGIKVTVVDVDKYPELREKFKVTSVPTLLALKNGKERGRSTSVISKEEILEMLNK